MAGRGGDSGEAPVMALDMELGASAGHPVAQAVRVGAGSAEQVQGARPLPGAAACAPARASTHDQPGPGQ